MFADDTNVFIHGKDSKHMEIDIKELIKFSERLMVNRLA